MPPLLLIVLPALLVLKQPDLGTAGMLIMGGGALFFAAGVRLWKFAVLIAGGLAAIPVGWNLLHDYQKNRVLTFIDPERGREEGMRQFLDEKSYKPGLGSYKRKR